MKHWIHAVDDIDESRLDEAIACDSAEKLTALVRMEKIKKIRRISAVISAVAACLVLFILVVPGFVREPAPMLMAEGNTPMELEENLGFRLPDLPKQTAVGKPPVLTEKPNTETKEAEKQTEKEIDGYLVTFYTWDGDDYFAFWQDGKIYCYRGNEKTAEKWISSLN